MASSLAAPELLWQMHALGFGKLQMTIRHILIAAACSVFLVACSQGPKGVRIVNNGTSAIPAKEGVKISTFTAAQIKSSIVGKNFQYTRPDGNGFITYNADGTFNYTDDTRGEGVGQWSANGGDFCETFGPGASQECGVFKNTGDAYFAAKSRLVEMKV
jgi:hypothetical protein